MMGLKKANKVFAVLLLIVMFLTNPICIGPLYAASLEAKETTNSEDQIELDSKTQVMSATEAANLNASNLTDSQRFNQFVNRMIPYYLKGGKKNGPDWLRTTDVKFFFTEDYKPVFSFTTVQPFSQASDKGEMLFWQGRFAHQSDTNTANLGVGWRKLSSDKQQMVGLNLFYDYGFKYNLSRVGTGVEYFNKLAEYRANFYLPTSGDRQTGVTYSNDGILYSYIRAVQGFDYEVGTALKNAQWLKFYASGFYYDNKYHEDEEGFKLRSVMQLTPRFSAELGYEKSNLASGSLYGKVAYQLADRLGPNLSGNSRNKEEKRVDLTYKLLQEVERNNDIKTETFTKLVSYTGSVKASVINSNGTAIQGAKVQAYQNGSAVGSVVTTDASGTADITGLAVGTYTVRATYYTFSSDSSLVTVTKDIAVNATISLPVSSLGNATVTVVDAQSTAISGASVTATLVDSTVAQAKGTLFDRILGVKTAYAATTSFSVTVTANASGVANFSNLPPGTYRFTATVNNITMNSIQVSVPLGGTVQATVMVPSTLNSGNISATVKDASTQAVISGATVEAISSGNVQSSKTTGSDGIAILGGLTEGTYTLSVFKKGYASNTASAKVTSGNTASSTVSLTPQTGSVDVTLSGIMAAANYTVTVTDSAGGTHTGTVNKTSTTATISSIPAGNCTVAVAAPNGYTTTITPSSFTMVALSSQAVAVSSTSQGSGNIDVTLSGTMATSDYTVTVTDSAGATHMATVKSGSTTATISSIPAGNCTVAVAAPSGYITTITPNNFTLAASGSQAVSVASSNQGNGSVNVTLGGAMATSDYTVTVTDSAGAAHTGTVKSGSTTATISSIPAGSCTVAVTAPSGYITTITPSNFIMVASGSQAVSVASSNQGNGSVTITLSGAMATADYTVTVTDSAGATHTGTVKSGSTTATISSIPAGSCTVSVTAPSGYTTAVTPNSFTLAASGNQAVAVSSSSQGNGTVDVTLSGTMATSDYTVTVTDSAGATHTGTVKSGNTTATISSIPAGSCKVTVTAPNGYTTTVTPNSFTLAASGSQVVAVSSASQGNGSVNLTLSGTDVSASEYTVTVTDSAGATHIGGIRSGSATATINSIPAGSCKVAVTAPSGYTATVSPSSFTLAVGGSQAVAVASTLGTGSVNVTLNGAMATTDYTVTVTDNASGQHIGIVNSGSTTTTISNIPIGLCTVAVTAPSGYSTVVTPSSFTMAAAGSQAVTVESSSQGNGSVNVTLSGVMATSNYNVTVTDSAGATHTGTVRIGNTTATINSIPAGKCMVTVTAPSGYTTTVTPNSFTLAASGSQTVSVVSSSQGNGSVDVTLSGTMATSDYTITVTDSAGATHTGAVKSGNTTATISSIPAGSCTVAVTTPSGYTTIVTPNSFTLAASGSQAVAVVSSSQGNGSVDVTLSGTMATSDYTVTVTDSAGATHMGTVKKTSTTATISSIPAGSCTVTVTAPSGYSTTITPSSFTLTTSGSQAVTVSSASQGSGSVDVTLSGTMATSDYTVTVTDSTGAIHIGTVKKTGSIATISSIPAGSCIVTVTAPSGYTTTITPNSFTLAASGSQAVAVASSSLGNGTVHVVLSGTMSASDYTVTITDSAGMATYTGTVNSTSLTKDIPIPAGSYSVAVTSPTGYTTTQAPASGTMTVGGTQTVTVTSSIQTFTINASAGSGGSISPSGAVSAVYGSTPTFTITADSTHKISGIFIDGSSTSQPITATGVGGSQNYQFASVTGAGHTISATFEVSGNPVHITVHTNAATVEVYNTNYDLIEAKSTSGGVVTFDLPILIHDGYWIIDSNGASCSVPDTILSDPNANNVPAGNYDVTPS